MQRPVHEVLWLNCAAKRCCSIRTVLPTGADIWRIAASMDVPPDSFLRTIPAAHDEDGGFVLAPAGQRFHAALARQPMKGRATTCVFLLEVNGVARCGLGALRPLACQAFPATLAGEMVRVVDEPPCSCRTWTLADLDRAHAGALLHQQEHERAQYRAVIDAWNARVGAALIGAQFAFGDFCRYLLEVYEY